MARSEPISVCTVDSLPVIHGGVRHVLAPFTDLAVVDEAHDEGELLRLVERHPGAVLLVEIEDLGLHWAETLRSVRQLAPKVVVVVFTGIAYHDRVRDALTSGANGYVLKRASPLTLATAIRGAAAGHRVLAPEASQALLISDEYESTLLEPLTERQREVLALMSRGLSNMQIADRLCVSVSTVKFHVSAISEKLGVKGRAQAIVRAFDHSLVPRRVPDARRAARGHTLPERMPV
jgi:two-component system, NarL family, response regulator LiaR